VAAMNESMPPVSFAHTCNFTIKQFTGRESESCDRRPRGRQMESTVEILMLPAELSGIDEILWN